MIIDVALNFLKIVGPKRRIRDNKRVDRKRCVKNEKNKNNY